MIAKNGHEWESYAIVFSMQGCAPCTRMYPVVHQLRKEGYPIYFFTREEYPDVVKRAKVRVFPTIIVYHGGRAIERVEGTCTVVYLRERLSDD